MVLYEERIAPSILPQTFLVFPLNFSLVSNIIIMWNS